MHGVEQGNVNMGASSFKVQPLPFHRSLVIRGIDCQPGTSSAKMFEFESAAFCKRTSGAAEYRGVRTCMSASYLLSSGDSHAQK